MIEFLTKTTTPIGVILLPKKGDNKMLNQHGVTISSFNYMSPEINDHLFANQ